MYGRGKQSTSELHMPSAHRAHAQHTVEALRVQAITWASITVAWWRRCSPARPPALGVCTCQGIPSLARRYPDRIEADRIEAAAARALAHHALSYGRLKSILEKNLDRVPVESPPPVPALKHENVRGAAYFGDEGA
jgi:hypothetical protein